VVPSGTSRRNVYVALSLGWSLTGYHVEAPSGSAATKLPSPFCVASHPTAIGIDGVDLCKGARLLPSFPPLYILMVTSASETSDVTAGLDAGADDYVIKPFKAAELKARAQVGMRMVALQESMARRLAELEQALANVKALRGLLPMCSYCKKIRVDDKYWQQLEGYLSDHSEAEFSHGICPECFPSVMDGIRNDSA